MGPQAFTSGVKRRTQKRTAKIKKLQLLPLPEPVVEFSPAQVLMPQPRVPPHFPGVLNPSPPLFPGPQRIQISL